MGESSAAAGVMVDRCLDPSRLEDCAGMTFPAFRHLLRLAPGPRHLGKSTAPPVQPVAVTATAGDRVVGLALAEMPVDNPKGASELLSVVVTKPLRGQGLGSALLNRLEREMGAAGCRFVGATYMTGTSSYEIVEKMLRSARWQPPSTRMYTLRATAEEAMALPWFKRHRLREGFSLFPWAELGADELAEMKRSQAESPWIAPDLQPWDHDRDGFEPKTSVGIRYDGRVVGWVINHLIAKDTVRFTCSYLRKDLSRFGRIIPAYIESITRLSQTDMKWLSFTVPVHHKGMAKFVSKRCAPGVSFFAETRGTAKLLGVDQANPEPAAEGDS